MPRTHVKYNKFHPLRDPGTHCVPFPRKYAYDMQTRSTNNTASCRPVCFLVRGVQTAIVVVMRNRTIPIIPIVPKHDTAACRGLYVPPCCLLISTEPSERGRFFAPPSGIMVSRWSTASGLSGHARTGHSSRRCSDDVRRGRKSKHA